MTVQFNITLPIQRYFEEVHKIVENILNSSEKDYTLSDTTNILQNYLVYHVTDLEKENCIFNIKLCSFHMGYRICMETIHTNTQIHKHSAQNSVLTVS